jgi:O-antigen ligase
MERLHEPSTWAGVGAMIPAIGELFITGGKSATAWGAVIAGLVAIFKREGK